MTLLPDRTPLVARARAARERYRDASPYPHAPVLDRLLVMAHGDTYWHGHPAPLACPIDRFRASITAYYYVAAASPDDAEPHGAIWRLP